MSSSSDLLEAHAREMLGAGPEWKAYEWEADFDKRRHVVQWGTGQPRKRTVASNWVHPLRWNAEA